MGGMLGGCLWLETVVSVGKARVSPRAMLGGNALAVGRAGLPFDLYPTYVS